MSLIVSQLNKSFSIPSGADLQILKDISFQIKKGTSLAIMGPSGCGKSTLISIVAGLEALDSGTISFDQENYLDLQPNKLNYFRNENIGIIFQQFHLLPHFTALENVELPLEFDRNPQRTTIAQEKLEGIGLGQRLNHYPHQLSRGECQRVAIARSLVRSPQIILADEPTGSLDQKTALYIGELLNKIKQEHNSILLLVTHDPLVAKTCDCVISLTNKSKPQDDHDLSQNSFT